MDVDRLASIRLSFLPFMALQNTRRKRQPRTRFRRAPAFVAGEDPKLSWPPGRLARLKLRKSDGKEIQLTADEGPPQRSRYVVAGHLFSRDQADHELRRFAESAGPGIELEAIVPRIFFSSWFASRESKTDAGSRFVWSRNDQRQFWTALTGALILLLVEPFVANRTSV